MAQNLVRIYRIKLIYGGTKCYELFISKLYKEALITDQECLRLNRIALRHIREYIAELIEILYSNGEESCQKLITCLKQDDQLRPFFPITFIRSTCVKSLATYY